MSMEYIKAAGLLSEPTEVHDDVAKMLALRFELFYALGGTPTFTELNNMNPTELHACSLARAVHDSRIANIIKDQQATMKNKMAIEEAATKAAGKFANQGAGVT